MMRGNRTAPLAVALLAAGAAAGCAASSAAARHAELVRAGAAGGDPSGVAVAEVPFVTQEGSDDCAVAAAAVVLERAGRPVSRARLARRMVRPRLGGSFTFDLSLLLHERGLLPWERRAATLEDVEAFVGAGLPPILLLAVRPFATGYRHFVVVTAIDHAGDRVLVHDGQTPHAPIARSDLMERWDRAGRWMLVGVPPEAELPERLAQVTAAERARLGWLAEKEGSSEAARRHYRAALRADPSLDVARANLGGVLLDLDRPAEAEAVLRASLAERPDDATVLNNLACALLARARALPAESARRRDLLDEAERHARRGRALADPALLPHVEDTMTAIDAARGQPG